MKLFLRPLFFILIFIIASSCIDKCDGNTYKFRMRIELLIESDEKVVVSYLTNESSNQSKRKTLEKTVNGKPNNQFIEFCFPHEPIELQINFSKNTKIKSFRILSALLENKENQMFINAEQFHRYFGGNKNVTYNKKEKSYIISKSPNQKAFLRSRKPMNKRLVNKLKL